MATKKINKKTPSKKSVASTGKKPSKKAVPKAAKNTSKGAPVKASAEKTKKLSTKPATEKNASLTKKGKLAAGAAAGAAITQTIKSGAGKATPRFNKPTEEDLNRENFNEDTLGMSDDENLEASPELEETVEEETDSDAEGPPPWWKADPTGIEAGEDDEDERAEFDDSDEWTEEDEDWNSNRRESFDEIEEAGEDEDERW